MDFSDVDMLFRIISGEEEGAERFGRLIELAVSETRGMLRSGADTGDIRLSFLAAAIANYRLQQMYAARERAAVTYAGKVLKESQNTACEYAKALVRDYMKICGELLEVSDFVFSSFCSSEEEIIC